MIVWRRCLFLQTDLKSSLHSLVCVLHIGQVVFLFWLKSLNYQLSISPLRLERLKMDLFGSHLDPWTEIPFSWMAFLYAQDKNKGLVSNPLPFYLLPTIQMSPGHQSANKLILILSNSACDWGDDWENKRAFCVRTRICVWIFSTHKTIGRIMCTYYPFTREKGYSKRVAGTFWLDSLAERKQEASVRASVSREMMG